MNILSQVIQLYKQIRTQKKKKLRKRLIVKERPFWRETVNQLKKKKLKIAFLLGGGQYDILMPL